MTTSPSKFTFKHAKGSVKRFYKKIFSTPDPQVRVRTHIKDLEFQTPPPPPTIPSFNALAETTIPVLAETTIPALAETTIPALAETTIPALAETTIPALAEDVVYAFGILGMVGPLDENVSGWMTTDFATWIFLISCLRGYHSNRSTWNAIRPFRHLFPDGHVVFGEAGCDRLQLPLPSSLNINADPTSPAWNFTTDCLRWLLLTVQKVKPGEKLVLLLIGHGDVDQVTGEFQFLVTTQSSNTSGESFINKHQLEAILELCQGEILVICNACFSGHLESDRWTLFCAADATESADALTESSSGNLRGSVFTACAVAQALQEHGWQVPLPRAVQMPSEPNEDQLVPLPPSPPPHSFSTPAAAQTMITPSTISFDQFLGRMQNMRQFLVENHVHTFQVKGSNSTASWNKILPFEFKAAIINQISVKPTPPTFSTTFNEICSTQVAAPQLERKISPALGSQSLHPLLVKLATLMPYVRSLPFTQNAVFVQLIEDLQRHIVEPERYANPLPAASIGEEPLLVVLRSTHIQALAVQQIARKLRWCSSAHEVTPFLPRQIESFEFKKMIEKGIRVDKLPYYLKTHCLLYDYPLWARMDLNNARWLSAQWAAAGKPEMKDSEWDDLVEKVAIRIAKEVIRE